MKNLGIDIMAGRHGRLLSMLAEDFQPNRLVVSREVIKDFM